MHTSSFDLTRKWTPPHKIPPPLTMHCYTRWGSYALIPTVTDLDILLFSSKHPRSEVHTPCQLDP